MNPSNLELFWVQFGEATANWKILVASRSKSTVVCPWVSEASALTLEVQARIPPSGWRHRCYWEVTLMQWYPPK